jgi:arylsulfatase A-like enzyme
LCYESTEIKYLNEINAAAPDKPFFLYYVPGGTHAPHQPTQEWIDKFKGKFDMGWNALREQIFANQKRGFFDRGRLRGVNPSWPSDR